MAPRTSTKTKAASEQAAATKPQDTPSGEQQEQAQSQQQGTPPGDGQGNAETQGASQDAQGDTPTDGLTADYIEAAGFILNDAGDVVCADGRALPPVFAGDNGEAMVLQALALACVPALAAADGAWSLAADGSFRLLESGEVVVPAPANHPTLAEFLNMKTPPDQALPLAVVDEASEMGKPGELTGSQAVFDVLAERARQIKEKGYSAESDDTYTTYELPRAAVCYAMNAAGIPRARVTLYWPFGPTTFKPDSPRRDLVRAAALLLAEIDRLDRAAS